MVRKSIYTKSLGEALAKNAGKRIPGKYHVIPVLNGRWWVVAAGSVRPIKSFLNRNEAIQLARKSAMSRLPGTVVIHKQDGRVEREISYCS